MSDDASLTEFAGGEDGEDDDEPVTDSPETPTFTYTSTPDGAECAACGAVVEKRWRAGEGGAAGSLDLDRNTLVCPDCKEW